MLPSPHPPPPLTAEHSLSHLPSNPFCDSSLDRPNCTLPLYTYTQGLSFNVGTLSSTKLRIQGGVDTVDEVLYTVGVHALREVFTQCCTHSVHTVFTQELPNAGRDPRKDAWNLPRVPR